MNPDSRRRLEAFIARIGKLESYPYYSGGTDIAGCKEWEAEGQSFIEFHAPPDHDTEAVLLNLRLFIQNDDISIGRLAELYDDPGVSESWKTSHRHWRAVLNERLTDIHAEGPKGRLTYRDVLDMFLYGELGHFRQTDHAYKLRQEWLTSELERAMLASTFQQVIIWILAIAHNIAVASRKELARVAAGEKGGA